MQTFYGYSCFKSLSIASGKNICLRCVAASRNVHSEGVLQRPHRLALRRPLAVAVALLVLANDERLLLLESEFLRGIV